MFNEWNKWLESGNHEILKDEQGLYTVLPKENNRIQPIEIEEEPRQDPKDTGAIEIEYIPPVDATSPVKKEVPVKWGHLIDDTEGVVKASFDRHNNRINHEKSEDIMVNDISISESKVYIKKQVFLFFIRFYCVILIKILSLYP